MTLPIDSGPSRNQSNLYTAVWFGMSLSDPLAWLDQCFLELQLYPDSNWQSAASGNWIAAAVAWQIEASTGYEDPCYYSPLYNHGNSALGYLNLTEGDQLTVSMNGWESDPWGENITLDDRTTGNTSNVTLFDPYGNFPLDPAYSTNSFENGLQWTPGGEYPAVFAFETGHARNPNYPSNTSFNYCVPGRPPATASNPYVPCPSYDPASWANDSLQPWRIGVPTFEGANGSVTPAQVSFSQDLGGIDLDESSPGCPGNEGSEYCSYPWYSYSCSTKSFQFGATDYLGTTSDFGDYRQYATTSETNNLGFGYYAPTNFTIPTCGARSANVGVGVAGTTGGSVYFLSHSYGAAAIVTKLSIGEYSIHALNGAGAQFQNWTTTGRVKVVPAASAWASLEVRGNGSIIADFSSNPPMTLITFQDQYSDGAIDPANVAVFPNYLEANGGVPLGTFPNGSAGSLPSQIYSILAYAPPGQNFTHWSVSSSAAVVAASEFPDSWFVVTGLGSQVTLTAWYAPSPSKGDVSVSAYGNGTVSVAGTTGTSFTKTLPVGTYSAIASPRAGWGLNYWYSGGSIALAAQGPSTNFTLENGSSSLEAVFEVLPATVLIETTPSAGGRVSFGAPTTLSNGSTTRLALGTWAATALPASGYRFTGWTVNRTSAAWPESPTSVVSEVEINASVALIAHFSSTSEVKISFLVSPSLGGSIDFNFVTYRNGTSNSTAASGGAFPMAFDAAPGFHLNRYVVTSSATYNGLELVLGASNVSIEAYFLPNAPTLCAVTFVSVVPNDAAATLNGTPILHGDTLWIETGSYQLTDRLIGPATFVEWIDAGSVAIEDPLLPTTSVNITGGGLIVLVGVPFQVTNASVTPGTVDVGLPVQLRALTSGALGLNATWSGLPPGCSNATVAIPVYRCTPTAAGSYQIDLQLTTSSGADLSLGPFPLRVYNALSILTFGASRLNVTVGASTQFSISVPAGSGTPPLSYLYTDLPVGCVTQNTNLLVCSPTAAGSSTVSAFVTDALGVYAQATLSIRVNPAPRVVSLRVSPSPITLGVGVSITVGTSGGSGPFSYVWIGLPSGCVSANAAHLNCVPTSSGQFAVSLHATDSDGIGTQALTNLTVDPAPIIRSFVASPAVVVLGNSTNFVVEASGGTGALEYSYFGLPPDCPTQNSSRVSCHPTQSGNFTIEVIVSDQFGVNSSRSIHFEVNRPNPRGPTGSGAQPGPNVVLEWAVGLAVLVVVAVAGLFWWRRRGRSASPSQGA
ncbi:MAG TPA: hypothetical protein VGS23_04030 [Thermoplasmata archaeon]|nr:hypothetical protein [Thermoplasmata archaeon]